MNKYSQYVRGYIMRRGVEHQYPIKYHVIFTANTMLQIPHMGDISEIQQQLNYFSLTIQLEFHGDNDDDDDDDDIDDDEEDNDDDIDDDDYDDNDDDETAM